MPQESTAPTSKVQPPEVQASTYLAQCIRHAFCATVNASGLPPMTVLELAAAALGVIYAEAAAAHRGPNGCPCGWHPETDADLEALRVALETAGGAAPRLDLRYAVPLGRG